MVPPPTGEAGVTNALVERARHGDHQAFEQLTSPVYHRLYALARRILRDDYGAEDAVQEALVRAWRDLHGLRDADRFEAWLIRLLVHACADQVRHAKRRVVTVQLPDIDPPTPHDDVARMVDRDELERAFLELAVEHRAVLVLSLYVGMTGPEVAATLGIPTGTVASRLHYATRRMRAILGRSGDAPQPEPVR